MNIFGIEIESKFSKTSKMFRSRLFSTDKKFDQSQNGFLNSIMRSVPNSSSWWTSSGPVAVPHFTALTTKLTAVNRYSTPNFEVNHSMIILLLFLTWKFTRGFLFSPDLFFGLVKTFWNLVKILTCTWLYLNQFLWSCQKSCLKLHVKVSNSNFQSFKTVWIYLQNIIWFQF